MNIHAASLAILSGCVLLTACATNPATGERQLSLISEQQEIEMGRSAAEQARDTIGLVKDPGLQNYVSEIGRKLAADSERPELPWSFQVADDPTPNAFALPGGFIFVTRGMLGYMDSEAELAAVLGHEIAHVTARHSVQQISRAQLGQLGLGLGLVLFPDIQPLGDVLSSGLQLLFLKYGRDAEREADRLGFGYALDARYDVREMDDVFATLQRIARSEGGSPLPAWASTHPDPGERIENVEARLRDVPAGQFDSLRAGRDEFLQHIDGLAWGQDPRQGFFRDNRFIHPEFRFQIAFPEGWRTQNLPQAVVAASPRQDGMIQLTLAKGTPAEAAQRFSAQSAVQAGGSLDERINGLPAVLVRFRAQTEQGPVQGLAGFVGQDDRTYQIAGIAAAGKYAGLENSFLQSLGSFAPVSDPALLQVEARRIDVVQIPRAMSLAQFATAYPSSVDLETLALINAVRNTKEMLPAGTKVKRVIETTAAADQGVQRSSAR